MSVKCAAIAVLVLLGVAGVAPFPAAAGPDPVPTITVSPAVDLVDAQAVTVEGEGWDPGAPVIVAQCRVGDDRCGWAIGVPEVAPDGTFSSVVRLRTVFLRERGGTTDCRAVACEVRAVDESGFETTASASASTTFDPSAPLAAPPTLTVSPPAGIRDGDRVTVDGAQFFFVSDVVFVQCPAGTTNVGVGGCSPVAGSADLDDAGTFTIDVQVRAVIGQDGDQRDCRIDPCEVLASMFPYTSVVARGALGFDPDAPLRPPPELVVTPTSGLVDGQTVQVSGSGFRDGESVSVVECRAGGRPFYEACDVGGGDHVRVGPRGLIDTQVVVGVRFDPQLGEPVDCRSSGCVVRASRSEDDTWVEVPISFAPVGGAPASPVSVTPAFTG